MVSLACIVRCFRSCFSDRNLLYQVVQEFAAVDLSPKRLSNFGMGSVFEELIRKFAESSNETAGEHFTPRDIVHLATSLVMTGEEDQLKPGKILTIYDFYVFEPPRPLEAIDADLKECTDTIKLMIEEMAAV